MSASCQGFFPPKRQTRRHVAQHVGTDTDHVGNIKPCRLLRCRVNVVSAWRLPNMFAHVGKKTTNSSTILCNNQIIMAAARWRLGRCVGRPLKVAAALGHGDSGGRWATRALTSTSCDERGSRRAGTSNLTINYFKQNATPISRRYGTQCDYYETLRDNTTTTSIREGWQDRISHDDEMQRNRPNNQTKRTWRDVSRGAIQRQGKTRHNDATTQRCNDATMQRCDNGTTWQQDNTMTQRRQDERDNERRGQHNNVGWRRDGTGSNDKGQRDDATTNQTNKRTDKQTNKQSGCDVRWQHGKRWRRCDARGWRRRMIFLCFVGGGAAM